MLKTPRCSLRGEGKGTFGCNEGMDTVLDNMYRNEGANAIAKMTLASLMHITWCILVEFLHKLNIGEAKVVLVLIPNKPIWKDDIHSHMLNNFFTTTKKKEKKKKSLLYNCLFCALGNEQQ